MLDTLDVLIGFVLVMLVLSMAVTMIVQFIGTWMLNLRGHALHLGMSHLLALLDRGLQPREARRIADHLLRNPLVGHPHVSLAGAPRYRLASTIHREEFVKLVLDFAVYGDADKAALAEWAERQKRSLDDLVAGERLDAAKDDPLKALRIKVRTSLVQNGIDDPKTMLAAIRTAALELEKTNPELSNAVRANLAVLHNAHSEFLAKVNAWFDQTVDRASEIFTGRTRIVTALVSLFIAVLLQVDAINLMNRLAVDEATRTKLVAAAIARVDAEDPDASPLATGAGQAAGAGDLPTAAGPAGTATADDASPVEAGGTGVGADADSRRPAGSREGVPAGHEVAKLAATDGDTASDDRDAEVRSVAEALDKSGVRDLERFGVVNVPRSWDDWVAGWRKPDAGEPKTFAEWYGSWRDDILVRLFGILLTAALLSLGAPFWYSTLRNLVKLRSVVSMKDDAERAERQTTQAAPSPAGAGVGAVAALPPAYRGEAGDLAAAG